jgi:hypothetical protein
MYVAAARGIQKKPSPSLEAMNPIDPPWLCPSAERLNETSKQTGTQRNAPSSAVFQNIRRKLKVELPVQRSSRRCLLTLRSGRLNTWSTTRTNNVGRIGGRTECGCDFVTMSLIIPEPVTNCPVHVIPVPRPVCMLQMRTCIASPSQNPLILPPLNTMGCIADAS